MNFTEQSQIINKKFFNEELSEKQLGDLTSLLEKLIPVEERETITFEIAKLLGLEIVYDVDDPETEVDMEGQSETLNNLDNVISDMIDEWEEIEDTTVSEIVDNLNDDQINQLLEDSETINESKDDDDDDDFEDLDDLGSFDSFDENLHSDL